MFESLTFIAVYAITMLSSGSEFAHKKLQEARDYFSCLSSNISPDELFRLHLLQGHYERSVELLRLGEVIASEQHLKMATTMASIESDPAAQQQATQCARFIYHDLVDRGIIRPEKANKRSIDQILAELQRDSLGVQGKFIKAIQDNDIQQINYYLSNGAQPNLSSNYMMPIDHAIARGHKEALELLYSAGVQPIPEHLAQANIFRFLLTSNQADRDADIIFTDSTAQPPTARQQSTGYAETIAKYQILINSITRKLQSQPSRP